MFAFQSSLHILSLIVLDFIILPLLPHHLTNNMHQYYIIFSQVRLCKDRTTDNLFAIKIISKEMLKKRKSGNTTETYFEDIRREIAIMKKLLHPNVLRLYEVLDDPNVRTDTFIICLYQCGSCYLLLYKSSFTSTSSSL